MSNTTPARVSDERLWAILDGCEGVPKGPWAAYMDDYTVHMDASHFIPDNLTLALCATGTHAFKLTPHIARLDPQTVSAIITRLMWLEQFAPIGKEAADER